MIRVGAFILNPKKMRITIIYLSFHFICPVLIGQTISSLRFEPSGKMIDVYYDLSGKTDESFQVNLYCSLDGGKTWGVSLKYVSGAVGENIKPGIGKKITWDVLQEKDKLVGEIKFKVEANALSGCRSFTVTHSAGSVAPVTKTVTYGVVETNLSGSKKCWITQNLGADSQASSATDASEAAAGWYWQFNRKQGFKHDGTNRTPNTKWNSSISENSNWLSTNDPCTLLLGNGWRLPLGTEWETADAIGSWDNHKEAYASVLKLHAAGSLDYSNGSRNYRGSCGTYWGSLQNDSGHGRCFSFDKGDSLMYNGSKEGGHSVRCLRD